MKRGRRKWSWWRIFVVRLEHVREPTVQIRFLEGEEEEDRGIHITMFSTICAC